jgi:hypothetical protein
VLSKRIGGVESESGRGITYHNNEIIITGDFIGTVNFGGGNISSINALSHDFYVAKYSTSGSFVWVKHGGGHIIHTGNDIATDSKR